MREENNMEKDKSGMGVAALVLGIISILGVMFWYIAFPAGILAIIFGVKSLKKMGVTILENEWRTISRQGASIRLYGLVTPMKYYKDILKENKAWLGTGIGRWISGFIVPDGYELYGTETKINEDGKRIVATNSCLWLTNIDH